MRTPRRWLRLFPSNVGSTPRRIPARSPGRRSSGLAPRSVPLAVQALEPRLALAAAGDGLPPPLASSAAPSVEAIKVVGPAGKVVMSEAALARKTYTAGERLTFRVTFSEPVVVTGTPTLPLEIGASACDAAWTGAGNRTRSLTFAIRIDAGVFDARGARIAGPLGLADGAAIRNVAGVDAVPTATGEFPGVRVDSVGPSVVGFDPLVVGPRGGVSLRVRFDGPVRVSGTPAVPFTVDGVRRNLAFAGRAGDDTLLFAYRPRGGERPSATNVGLPVAAEVRLAGRGAITDRVGNRARSLATPTGVVAPARVAEDLAVGGTIGRLSAVDSDGERDDFTYAIVPGVGGADNALFAIEGDRLKSTSAFDFERRRSHSLRVRVTDSGGLWKEQVVVVAVTDVQEEFAPDLRQAFQAALDATRAELGFPGAIAGVWSPSASWVGVTGVAAAGADRAPARSDHSRIGSVTKTFTAISLLQQVDKGLVDLDDPIEKYVPGMPNGTTATLRMLANMTSGIPSYSTDVDWLTTYFSDTTTAFTPNRLVDYARGKEPLFPAGTGFDYSNTNTVLLGLVIEQVTGRPIAEVFQEEIFGPLGMKGTSYPGSSVSLPAPHLGGITLQPDGEGSPKNATFWNPSWTSTAGAMISRIDDLLLWGRVLGTGGGLISPGLQRERLESVAGVVPGDIAYGLGFASFGGWLGHNGRLPGFTAYVVCDPATETVVAVMANSDIGESPPADTIGEALAALVPRGTASRLPAPSVAGR